MKTIVTGKIPLDPLAKTFWDAYREDIMKFALCHNGTEGYVRVSVTKDYTLKSMDFIEGAVNMKEFIFWNECKNPWPYWEDEPDWYCFEIYYPAIKTLYRSGVFYNNFNKIVHFIYNPQ
jgi:hypothetical protein